MIASYPPIAHDMALAMMYQKANPYSNSSRGSSQDVVDLERKMTRTATHLQDRVNALEKQLHVNGNYDAIKKRLKSLESDLALIKQSPPSAGPGLDKVSIDRRLRQLESDVSSIGSRGASSGTTVPGSIQDLTIDMAKVQVSTLMVTPPYDSFETGLAKSIRDAMLGTSGILGGKVGFTGNSQVSKIRTRWLERASQRVSSSLKIDESKYNDVLVRFLLHILSTKLEGATATSLGPGLSLTTPYFTDIVRGEIGDTMYFSTKEEVEYIAKAYNYVRFHVLKEDARFKRLENNDDNEQFFRENILYFISMNNAIASLTP
jgi:hypothetical protein